MNFSEVKIKSPCTKKLEKSGAGCSGQYCSSCNKIVYDFRDASEEEFNERILEMGEDKCGIFYKDQIHFEVYRNSATPRLFTYIFSILAFFGISNMDASAQGGTKHVRTEKIVGSRASHGPEMASSQKPYSKQAVKDYNDKPRETGRRYNVKKQRRKFLSPVPVRSRGSVRGRF